MIVNSSATAIADILTAKVVGGEDLTDWVNSLTYNGDAEAVKDALAAKATGAETAAVEKAAGTAWAVIDTAVKKAA